MPRTLWPILALVLTSCAHQDLRFGLYVDELEEGNRLPAHATQHRAAIKETTRNALLQSSAVEWSFDGALEAANEPGTFKVKGPGQGTIRATFRAGTQTHTLSAVVRVPGSLPKPAQPPLPSVAIPSSPLPVAPPTPAPLDPEALVYKAYDLAGRDMYFEAVDALQSIAHPDWLPKSRTLVAEWSPKAVDQGLTRARARIAEGDPVAARVVLEKLSHLPKSAPQAKAFEALQQQLR